MTDNGKEPARATLYANMAKVMGVLKTIPKNGRNKQQGYDFVTDSDLLDAIRRRWRSTTLRSLPT